MKSDTRRPISHLSYCEESGIGCWCTNNHRRLMINSYRLKVRLNSMAVRIGAAKRTGRQLLRAPVGAKKGSQLREFTIDGDLDVVHEYSAKLNPKLDW